MSRSRSTAARGPGDDCRAPGAHYGMGAFAVLPGQRPRGRPPQRRRRAEISRRNVIYSRSVRTVLVRSRRSRVSGIRLLALRSDGLLRWAPTGCGSLPSPDARSRRGSRPTVRAWGVRDRHGDRCARLCGGVAARAQPRAQRRAASGDLQATVRRRSLFAIASFATWPEMTRLTKCSGLSPARHGHDGV